MKIPTEAELIELENCPLAVWDHWNDPDQRRRVRNTLDALIALARGSQRFLELTEEELTCIWAALSVLDMHKPGRPVSAAHARVDAGLVSVLEKLDKLMQAK